MKKLLVVDDEEAMRGLYRKRLSKQYEVFETGDPEQALALALEHKPDAILLDLKMPKFDGFALCQNFRSLNPTCNLPIYIITGQSVDYKKECEKLGATGFFAKPIDFVKLTQTLAAALDVITSEQRGPASLRMRVALKLRGTDVSGEFTDPAETETVDHAGFSFISSRELKEGVGLDVFFAGRNERYVGRACIGESLSAGLERRRYRLNFEGQCSDWIVQKTAD